MDAKPTFRRGKPVTAGLILLLLSSCDRFAGIEIANLCARAVDVRILGSREAASRADAGGRFTVPARGTSSGHAPLADRHRTLVVEVVDASGNAHFIEVAHEARKKTAFTIPREMC